MALLRQERLLQGELDQSAQPRFGPRGSAAAILPVGQKPRQAESS